MQKKLLFFCSVTQIGGAETNILKISRELYKRGNHIHFATLENNGPMFQACKSYSTAQREIGRFGSNPIASIKKYVRLLKLYRIDVVFNFGLRVEVFSRLVTRVFSPQTRIVANIRSTNNFRKWYEVLLDRMTAPLVDVWVSNSEAGKRAFVKREKIKPERIRVIYNYIDHTDVPEGFVNHKRDAVYRIGVLANIKKMKGHFDLIPLSLKLKQLQIRHEFVCAGVDNTNGLFAKEVAKQNCQDAFRFLGYTQDKSMFFSSIDVFLLPSYLEGMPTSVLESMIFGVPVISTTVDGIPEQITHLKNGLIYQPGDIEGFANGIQLLMNDEHLVQTFVEESRKILKQKFSKETNLALWEDVIQNTMNHVRN